MRVSIFSTLFTLPTLRQLGLHATLLAAALLVATSASASDSVTLELVGGGAVQGELVERVPQKKYVLKLATGEIRTIAWSEVRVARVQNADTTPPAPPAAAATPSADDDMEWAPGGPTRRPQPRATPRPAPAAPAAQVPTAPQGKTAAEIDAEVPMVTVSIRSEQKHVQLRRVTGGGEASSVSYGVTGANTSGFALTMWEDVCLAPCTVMVRRDSVYQIGGPNILSSRSFVLPEPNGDEVQLKVIAGSPTAQALAVIGLSLGIPGLVIAPVLLLAPRNDGRDAAIAVGLIAGVILTTVGILSLGSSTTDVRDANGTTIAKRKRPALQLTPQGVTF